MTSTLACRIALMGTLVATATLAACNGSTSDSAYKDAVKDGLPAMSQKELCWHLPAVNGKFPTSIKATDYDMANEAKKAALRAKVVTLVQTGVDYTVALTPAGEAAHAWDASTGNLCVGREELVDMKLLPGGDRGDDSDMRSVHYSWKLVDIPQWVKDSDKALNDLRAQNLGVDQPVQVDSVVAREKKGGPLVLEGS